MRIGTGITRHNILKLILMLYLGNIFLPIVFNNLPFPFYSYNFYLVVTLGSFVVLYPYSFLKKELVWFYVFVAMGLILRASVWEGRTYPAYEYESFLKEYAAVLLALTLFWHYIGKKDYETLWFLCRYSLVLSFISIINNFFVLSYFPEAFDLMAQGRAPQSLVDSVSRLGFIGYSFFNGISSYSPAMIYGAKNHMTKQRIRILWIVLFVTMFAILPSTNAAAFVLFAMLFGGFALFMGQNYKRDLYRLLGIMIIAILLPRAFTAGVLNRSAEIIDMPEISDRFADAAITIENPDIDLRSSEHTGRRLGRIPLLLESFGNGPLIGNDFSTGHVAWLDMLSLYGLLGFFPWFMLVFTNTKWTLRVIPKPYIPYYLLGSMAFISMGFLKNTGGYHVWVFWFFILPGTAFSVPREKRYRDAPTKQVSFMNK